jgi:hypothetical protein
VIGEQALADLHRAVEDACRSGQQGSLPVLGYGEISLVVAWPPEQPQWAAKRLPVFRDRAAVESYSQVLDRYVDTLQARGVDVLETSVQTVDGGRGGVTAYLVQPVVPAEALGHRLLLGAEPSPEHPVLAHVVDRIAAVVDDQVGFDGQLANWARHGDRFVYFDLTTPMLRDELRHWRVDGRLLAAAAPWALRPVMTKYVIPSIEGRYHDRHLVVLDVAVNLLRLRMQEWVAPLLAAARERAGVAVTPDEVQRDYRSESRTWKALQLVRRTDRAWQMRVRHRPYPFLIPERTGW